MGRRERTSVAGGAAGAEVLKAEGGARGAERRAPERLNALCSSQAHSDGDA